MTLWSFRQIRFLICVIGALLIYVLGRETLFYLAAMVAMVNQFSSQMMCASGVCASGGSRWWPQDTATRVNTITSALGVAALLYGVLALWLRG